MLRTPPYTTLQWRVLLVITAMNFINYVDRQCIFPLFTLIKAEFDVSDFHLGLLGTVFMVVHSVAILPFGLLADHWNRTRLVSIGAFFWSVATLASGAATSFKALLLARAAVGTGESAYTPAAATMISDSFPAQERARVQSYYNLGMFGGGTAGMVIAGLLGSWLGWRATFFVVALPGMILAMYAWRTPDPARKSLARLEILNSLRILAGISSYRWVLAGGTLAIFSSGAFITWGTVFAIRYYGMDLREASLVLATTVLLAGVLGVLSGGWLADWLHARWAWGRAATIGISFLIAAPFLAMSLYAPGKPWLVALLFVSTYFMGFYHGPATAVIHDVTPEWMHGRSYALYIFLTHLIGDVTAPALVGKIADVANLRAGLLLAAIAVGVGGAAFLMAAWRIARSTPANPPALECEVANTC